MSWSYVGAFQFVGGTGTTYSPSFVGTLAENDLVVLCFSSKSDGVTPAQLSIGSGWTLLHASESTTTSEPGLHVWYCIAGAGGSIPSTTVTRTGGERHQCFGFAYRHTGGAPVKLADAAAVKLAASTTATLAGGINPSAAGSLLISAIAGGVVGVPNNITATSPSAYSASSSTSTSVSAAAPASDEWVQRFGSSSTAGSDHSHGLADAVKTTAGSTGSITWTKAAASMNTVFAVAFGPAGSGGGDTAAPTLTSPTASATGTTTASGSVTTDEANGTLYYLASTNATEPVATVKAGSSQAVSASGVQNVTVTGLTASTSYYLHFVHTDAAANDSTVATSAQFTTAAANTSPSFTGPNIDNISGTEGVALTPVDVSAKFFDSESGLTFSTVGSWPAGVTVSSAGVISGTPTTAGTYAGLQVRATDTESLTADSNTFTITVSPPAVAGISVTEPLKNNTGTVLASQSGVRVAVLQAADLVSVYETSGLTTNASGILATISDAAIITGQQYHVAIKLADGSVGITGPITAS